jgi:hypothetical protein
MPLQI